MDPAPQAPDPAPMPHAEPEPAPDATTVPAAPRPPRVWTALVGGLVGIIGATVASAIAIAIAAAILGFAGGSGSGRFDQREFEKTVTEFLTSPGGLLVMIIPGQLFFLSFALIAGVNSATPWRQRLGLVRGTLPPWSLPALLLGTLFVQFVAAALSTLVFTGTSEQLEMLAKSLASVRGPWVAPVVFAMSVLPGIAEELFFRGYVQRRLVERWGVGAGIAIATLLFTLGHVDPQHMMIVSFIGLWLGVVAWRTGSVWPAMVCHCFNNLAAACFVWFGVMDTEEPGAAMTAAIWGVPLLGFIVSIMVLHRAGRRVPAPGA